MPDASLERWEAFPQSLKFNLSYLFLGQLSFRALVLDPPLSSVAALPPEPAPPAALRPPFDAAVFRLYPVTTALPRISFRGGFLRYVPVVYSRAYVERSGEYKDYTARWTSKSRYKFNQRIKQYLDHVGGEFLWREFTTPAESAEFCQAAAAVAAKTYQMKLSGEGLADNPGTRERVLRLAGENRLHGYILYTRDEPAAYALCYAHGETLIYETVGFDPDLRGISPGKVLLRLIIERMHERKQFRYLDFGEGAEEYKEFFATGTMTCARVYFFRKTPRLVAGVFLHCTWNLLIDTLGRTLARFRLREKLRSLARRKV